jgi:hypothetical protein
MNSQDKPDTSSAIANAIRAKREHRSSTVDDIAALEASLIADIETFDLEAAERKAQLEQRAASVPSMTDTNLVFPKIAPATPERPATAGKSSPQAAPAATPAARPAPAKPKAPEPASDLISQLRQQAEMRQREANFASAERNAISEATDAALKRVFFYLHDLVQQLNIVKPAVQREYALSDGYNLDKLSWQEGFADYRTQSQSAGALVELVTFSYRLAGDGALVIERDGTTAERFRTQLFDCGLAFDVKEIRNERRYLERAEFSIRSELGVSARWRADFDNGVVVLETRNLERLGNGLYRIAPQVIDKPMMEAFGRLILGLPNRFREMAKER